MALTVLVFALHPASLLMSGACLKPSSKSKTVQFDLPRLYTQSSTGEVFFTSETSNLSVPMSFAVYFHLRSLSVWLSPSSSDKDRKSSPHTAILTSSFELWKNAALFFSSQFSTDQGHVLKLPDVRSILSSIRAPDQFANFAFAKCLTIFCWTTDVYESLGCSLEVCSADVAFS